MKKHLFNLLIIFLSVGISYSQETFPRNDVKDDRAKAYAFTNATIYQDYQTTLSNATLLIRDGKVVNVGSGIAIPDGYITIDLKGKYIYPSFVDPYTNYGLPAVKKGRFSWGGPEQLATKTEGAYNGNEAIKSHFNAAEAFTHDEKLAKKMRESGFGAVLAFRPDGIARGTSALVTLDNKNENLSMLKSKVAAHYSFDKGSSKQLYPFSQMGFISLIKQTHHDAQWYKAQKPAPFKDLSLDAWISSQNMPQIFETNGWVQAMRADKLGDEFNIQYIIKGGGDEYQRIQEVASTKAKFIIPLNFPSAPDVSDPYIAKNASLEELKHWEMAPANAAALEKAGVEFAFTTHGLKSPAEMLANLKKAMKYGLSKKAALKALTYNPSSFINADDQLGSLKKGKLANFIITSNAIFDDKSSIMENWIQGNRHSFKSLDEVDMAGKYQLTVGSTSYNLEISGAAGSQKGKIIINDSTNMDVTTKFHKNMVSLTYTPKDESGKVMLSGWYETDGLAGKAQLIDGNWVNWSAKKTGDLEKEESKEKKKDSDNPELGELIYPFVGHGNPVVPQQETILIKNGTLWTNETDGIVENTDILLKDGKIAKIGKDLSASGAKVIDAKGKHVTSGIIDEHSHIAASSINDVATNSSMVRIGDVIDPTDGHIYTSLSGGVTAVQILHGSANPIGGQSALIKMRWGANAEGMKIKGADGFIKFALGENVKRSSNPASRRFPQTRMGVEQVFVDAFTNAQEYQKEWKAYNGLSSKAKAVAIRPRKDLAMDAISEILNSERFISCHSYVQSEINMLMHVADRFNFKVNTFTHILEGYKVADKMAEHGVGASTFSDWWAYKWEVRYAIPYNAAIMHNAGVTVAINSDDSEMGRRLNQEAAKGVKYGGMSQEDAWKMVTLNSAKLLHLDDRMGSLKVGKDADVVVWSDNPLSIYAKVENTIVDGVNYYDVQKDAEMNEWITKERARLIQKIKADGGAMKPGKPFKMRREMFHCDDLTGQL